MSRIPQPFIDDLLNRLDIVEVIDSRVRLKKTGKNYSACCPFHKEKTPSFSVSPDKQFYYCFGCGATGTALGFLMEYEHLGFIDAVESLARTAGVEVPREQSHQPQKLHKNLYTLLEKANDFYQAQLREHPQRKDAVNYLKQRGLTGAVAKTFGIGFAPPGWDNLLAKLGLTDEDRRLLAEAGLLIVHEDSNKRYDRFRHRIMFPILDTRGRVIGFGGRILTSDNVSGKERGAGPKYLNSPETPVFFKGRELYGLYQARQNNRNLARLLVVEGYMDVIAMAQYDISYAVATLGTACGEDHLKLAFRHTNEIVFCFDGDNAGRRAAKRALENALPTMTDGRQIKFLFLPEGQDPDTLVRQIGRERFEEHISTATPLETFFFEAVAEGTDLRTMEGRARMSKAAAPLLHQLPSGVYRELMFSNLAQRTGLGMDVLQELMQDPAQPLAPPAPADNTASGPSWSANPPPSTAEAEYRQVSPEMAAIPAPPQALEPAPKNAPSSLGRVRFNPARLATAILLENPELLAEQALPELPQNLQDPDLDRLNKLISYLQSRPQTSFHSILGYWGGQYGLQAQRSLTELVANRFLGDVKRRSSYDSATELADALNRICQEEKIKCQKIELTQLAGLNTLTEPQKQRLRELLLQKAQMKITSH